MSTGTCIEDSFSIAGGYCCSTGHPSILCRRRLVSVVRYTCRDTGAFRLSSALRYIPSAHAFVNSPRCCNSVLPVQRLRKLVIPGKAYGINRMDLIIAIDAGSYQKGFIHPIGISDGEILSNRCSHRKAGNGDLFANAGCPAGS